jgi:hypothetical protein
MRVVPDAYRRPADEAECHTSDRAQYMQGIYDDNGKGQLRNRVKAFRDNELCTLRSDGEEAGSEDFA